MKKTILTCLMGLGFAPAFAGYTYNGPTFLTVVGNRGFVECLGWDKVACVINRGESTTPTRGDQIEIWDNGELVGTATVSNYVPTSPNGSDDGGNDQSQPTGGNFDIENLSY